MKGVDSFGGGRRKEDEEKCVVVVVCFSPILAVKLL